MLGTGDNKTPVVIASKPAAIYVLRSYLRLCMSMTIEMQINCIMANFSRGGTDALNAGGPMILAGTVGATITNPNAPIPPGPKAPPSLPGDSRFGKFEIHIPLDTIKTYQRALCVSPVDGVLGSEDSVTHKASGDYLKAMRKTDTSREFDAMTQGLRGRYQDGDRGIAGSARLRPEEKRPGHAIRSDRRIRAPQQRSGDSTRTAIAQFRLRALNPAATPSSNDLRDPQFRQLDDAVNRAILLSR